MDSTGAELTVAIASGLVFLLIASTAPMRFAIAGLLLLAPFHLVDELDITNSTAMTYMVVVGIMLTGKRLQIPMLGCMLLILLGYMLSISQVHPSLFRWHGISLIILVSGFIMFVLAYNLARTSDNARSIVNLILAANVLVDLYCLVQLTVGPGVSSTVFGFEAFAIEANRGGGDPRLSGPFGGAPGILAEYLALMTLIVVYDAMQSDRKRRMRLWLMVAVNVGLLVATANRGGFITLLVGAGGLLYTFRRDLGTMRVIQIAATGTVFLVLASFVVIKTTNYNIMFERLESVTQVEGGVPKTRQHAWPEAFERIREAPWFGQGPTWRLPMEHLGAVYPGRVYIDYPHSLYLYLLVTVGIVGTATFAVFFAVLLAKLLGAARAMKGESGYAHGLVRLGPLLLLLFLLDEIRIEFLRPTFSDYQYVVFGLLGLWLGLAHRAQASESAGSQALETEDGQSR